jgi:septal ring-binding cell division protein DamX
MEENSKLFVFEKKEVILIFVFIVLISVISFTLGVRTGKGLSLKHDDFNKQDVKTIDLKSVDEEFVDTVIDKNTEIKKQVDQTETRPSSTADSSVTSVDDQKAMELRLREEMEKLANEDVDNISPAMKVNETPLVVEKNNSESSFDKSAQSTDDVYNRNKDFKGKYTIQLFSNQSEEAAKDFADGFIVKGYDVIVNEVILAGKGKWYRVSIGVFDSVNDAKEYLNKENKLFQANKYIIQQF